MQTRMDPAKAAPEGYKLLGQLHAYVGQSGLDPVLVDLVYLRISQINGCAYCVDLHWRDAIRKGVDPRKLNAVAAWEEMPFFSERERAAFAWAESLTLVAASKVPDAVYEAARSLYGEKELADLSHAIVVMNAFNRLGVGFRKLPTA